MSYIVFYIFDVLSFDFVALIAVLLQDSIIAIDVLLGINDLFDFFGKCSFQLATFNHDMIFCLNFFNLACSPKTTMDVTEIFPKTLFRYLICVRFCQMGL